MTFEGRQSFLNTVEYSSSGEATERRRRQVRAKEHQSAVGTKAQLAILLTKGFLSRLRSHLFHTVGRQSDAWKGTYVLYEFALPCSGKSLYILRDRF